MKYLYVFIALVIVLYFSSYAHSQSVNVNAYYDLGVFAYEDHDYEQAKANFLRAIASNPNNPRYNHYLGKTLTKMNSYQDAEKYLIKAIDIDPFIPELKYDLAYLYFKKGDYSRSADMFVEVTDENTGDINILALYYAGVSFFFNKQYNAAIRYFESAALNSPSIAVNARYYSGLCHIKLQDSKNALKMFEFVKTHTDDEKLRENANNWIMSITTKKTAQLPYQILMKMACIHDDNPRLVHTNYDLGVEDDLIFQTFFAARYHIVNQQPVRFGIGYSHFQNVYNDLTGLDLIGSMLHVYSKYRISSVMFGLGFFPSVYWLNDVRYLKQNQIESDMIWVVSNSLINRFAYRYTLINNIADDNRDGHSGELVVESHYRINPIYRVQFGFSGNHTATQTSDYSYDEAGFYLSNSFDTGLWNIVLDAKIQYYNRTYDRYDSILLEKRRDSKNCLSFAVSRNVKYDWFRTYLEYQYMKNDSNLFVYDYKKNSVMVAFDIVY